MAQRTPRVAIIGAGPAGVYAADFLTRAQDGPDVQVDLYDRYPAPFGLIRYGVAPDHPRIKGIVKALHKILDRGTIRFVGNVDYGTDLTAADLREYYDAVIFATGAIDDAALNIPGIGLAGSHGAADFISWYDGHPDYPREWPLEATEIAVLGNGNVALDVARVLSKHADDLLSTEIPDNVYRGLRASPVTDVHVFGRRGPAQIKFTPLELKELAHSRDVDIVVYEEDFEFDEASDQAIKSNNQVRTMVNTLNTWLLKQEGRKEHASRRLHLHFLHSPIEILGEDGKVSGIRFERQKLDGNAGVHGTGATIDYPVQAVYRAIGYWGSPVADVPFDPERGVIPNEAGRVLDESGARIPGVFATGWIKRGPVGLIGHTKGDAAETVECLLADLPELPAPARTGDDPVQLLEARGVATTSWAGWLALDAHERELGAAYELPDGSVRERIKVVEREQMVRAARARRHAGAQEGTAAARPV